MSSGQPDWVTPGPGSYIEQSKQRGKSTASCNAFVNKVERFGPTLIEKENTPGPGMYRQEEQWIKNGSGARAQPQSGPAGDSSVVWFRNPSAPSVPTKAQSYGYEQGGDGRLVRQEQPSGGYSGYANDAAGPGDYNNHITALTNRTTSWSKSNSARAWVKESKTPGPGHYARPTGAADPAIEEEPQPGLSSFASKTTRGLQKGSKLKKKDLTPGPGAYAAPSMFDKTAVPENLQFFGSTSRRGFEVEPSQYMAPGNWKTPGPGTYEERRSGFKKNGRAPGGKMKAASSVSVPFETLQPRFRDSRNSVPGPGQYNNAEAKSLVTNLSHKTRARNGVFGTTANRFFGSEMHAEIAATGANPGPGQYDVAADGETGAGPKATGRRRRTKASSVFTSGTNRFSSSAPTRQPAPGDYDVQPRWPGEEPARLTLLERDVFISNANRFSTGVAGPASFTPGPGAYEQDVLHTVDPRHMGVASLEGRGTVGTAKRFGAEQPAKQALNIPGPGAYNAVNPADGLVKRSYNITVDV